MGRTRLKKGNEGKRPCFVCASVSVGRGRGRDCSRLAEPPTRLQSLSFFPSASMDKREHMPAQQSREKNLSLCAPKKKKVAPSFNHCSHTSRTSKKQQQQPQGTGSFIAKQHTTHSTHTHTANGRHPSLVFVRNCRHTQATAHRQQWYRKEQFTHAFCRRHFSCPG